MTLLQTPLLALTGRDSQSATPKGRGDGAGTARNAASFGDLYQAHVSGRSGSPSAPRTDLPTSAVLSAAGVTTSEVQTTSEAPVPAESGARSEEQAALGPRFPAQPRTGADAGLPPRPTETTVAAEMPAPAGTAARTSSESPASTNLPMTQPAWSFPARGSAVVASAELPVSGTHPAPETSMSALASLSISPEQEDDEHGASGTVDARSTATESGPDEITPRTHSEHADARPRESAPDIAPRGPGAMPAAFQAVIEPSINSDSVIPTAIRAGGEQDLAPEASGSAASISATTVGAASAVPTTTSSTDASVEDKAPAGSRPAERMSADERSAALPESGVAGPASDVTPDLGEQMVASPASSSSTTHAGSGTTASATTVAAAPTTTLRVDRAGAPAAPLTAPSVGQPDAPTAPLTTPAATTSPTPTSELSENRLVAAVPDPDRPRGATGSTSFTGTQTQEQLITGDSSGARDLLPAAPSREAAAPSAEADGVLSTSPASGTRAETAAQPAPTGMGVTATATTTAASAPPVPVRVPVPLPQQLGAPAFALAQSVADTAGGTSTITVTVAPEDLGPITIRASLSAEGTRLEFFSATEGGRDAVRQALPDLRREASASGLSAALDLGAGDPSDRKDTPPRQARTPVPFQQDGRQHEPAPSPWAGPRPSGSSTLDLLA